MKFSRYIGSAMAIALLTLTACGNDEKNDANDATDNKVEETTQSDIKNADHIADKITDLESVERANVLITDNNAYVGVMLTDGNGEEVTDEVKKDIKDQVNEADAKIDNVYVSANPDVLGNFDDYIEKIDQGEPIEGFFDEFNDMLDRMFPDRK